MDVDFIEKQTFTGDNGRRRQLFQTIGTNRLNKIRRTIKRGKKQKKPWTIEDLNYLRKNIFWMNIKEICKKLNRTDSEVRSRYFILQRTIGFKKLKILKQCDDKDGYINSILEDKTMSYPKRIALASLYGKWSYEYSPWRDRKNEMDK